MTLAAGEEQLQEWVQQEKADEEHWRLCGQQVQQSSQVAGRTLFPPDVLPHVVAAVSKVSSHNDHLIHAHYSLGQAQMNKEDTVALPGETFLSNDMDDKVDDVAQYS